MTTDTLAELSYEYEDLSDGKQRQLMADLVAPPGDYLAAAFLHGYKAMRADQRGDERETELHRLSEKKMLALHSKSQEKEGVSLDADSYQDLTVAELRDIAAERDITGRSSMNKDELVAALEEDDDAE